MINVEGYKAFRGGMEIAPVDPNLPALVLTGDWLYKPEYDCWYGLGRSFAADVCKVYFDETETKVTEVDFNIYMLDIFKRTLDNLPIDVKIVFVKELNSKWKLILEYNNITTTVELAKACTPKQEDNICWYVLATAMSNIYTKLGDLKKAKLWLDSLNNKNLIMETPKEEW